MADEPPEDRGGDPDGPRDPGEDHERPAGTEPLGDLADRIRRRRSGRGDGPPGPGDDGDRFVREGSFDPTASARLRGSVDEAATAAVEADEATDEHVVPKRSYCESCEHFGAPPAVHCRHPGTTIVEFVDADRVRVRSCPVVAERRASGESDREPGRPPGPFGRR